jgi:gliding motility-associated-like protein
MRKLFLLFGLLVALNFYSFAQFTPSLRCLYVKDDNSVSLYFIPVDSLINAGANVFQQYAVYYAANYAGPFTLLQDAMTTCNTDCFDGLDPVVHNYYYIKATYSGGLTYFSDTLAVMNTTVSNPGNGTALLTWTPDPYSPLPSTSDQYFSVYRKTPYDFDFSFAGIIPATSPHTFRDTINVCNDEIKYRVQIQNQMYSETSKCRNSSTVSTGIFQNTIAPNIPTLTKVSVDENTNRVNLTWVESSNSDVNSYVIFHSSTPVTTWVPIDTVWGKATITWEDNINLSSLTNNYRISARDSCGLASAMTIDYQSNMLLTSSIDPCHSNVTLSWTPYLNMTSGLHHYDILISINGSGYSVVASNLSPSTTSYVYNGLINNNNYSFIIEASNSSIIKCKSIKNSFDYIVEERTDYAYVASISVVDNKNLVITINTNGIENEFDYLELYRSEESPVNFTKIAEIPYQMNNTYTYNDLNLQVTKKTYYYRVLLYSDCLPQALMSNTANSILLTISGDAAHRNTLQWYNFDDNVPLTVNPNSFIQRKMETDGDFVEMVSNVVWSAYNSYVDDVSELQYYGSVFKYKVGVNQTTNDYGYCPASFSNEVTIKQKPTIWIPNAFRPVGSQNKVFKPINSFISASTYTFVIYNRYGQIVFQTTNPNEGWEGRLPNGEYAPAGVYAYKIEFIDNSDEPFITNGTVTLFY